jgi:hypothetical protein
MVGCAADRDVVGVSGESVGVVTGASAGSGSTDTQAVPSGIVGGDVDVVSMATRKDDAELHGFGHRKEAREGAPVALTAVHTPLALWVVRWDVRVVRGGA